MSLSKRPEIIEILTWLKRKMQVTAEEEHGNLSRYGFTYNTITQDPSWIIFARETKHSVRGAETSPLPFPQSPSAVCVVGAASLPEQNGEIQEHELYHWVVNFVYVPPPVMAGVGYLQIPLSRRRRRRYIPCVVAGDCGEEWMDRDADDDAAIKCFQSRSLYSIQRRPRRRQRPAPKEYIRTTSSRYFAG